MSSDGRVVMVKQQAALSGANQFTINTSNLQKGLYFLSVIKNGVIVQTQKFTKN
jgi:hypothetical protein